MYWLLFAYGVLGLGFLLTLMLISGVQFIVSAALKLLGTPIRIKSTTISLDLLLTGVCFIMTMIAYSGQQKAEHRLQSIEKKQHIVLNDTELRRNVAFHERNFWMSTLGFTLWGVAWRLKTLFVGEALVVQRPKARRPMLSRVKWGVFALACFILADVPLCRLNYSFTLITQISPKKETLMEVGKLQGCRDVMKASAANECANFCGDVRSLAEDRLGAVHWARDWHITGKYAAQLFDGMRGVQQGGERIDKLFAEKSCEGVLGSVDKSNHLVNTACGVFAVVSIIGAFIGLQNALSRGEEFRRRPAVGNTVAVVETANTREHFPNGIGQRHVIAAEAAAYQVRGHSVALFEDDVRIVEEAHPARGSSASAMPGPAVSAPAVPAATKPAVPVATKASPPPASGPANPYPEPVTMPPHPTSAAAEPPGPPAGTFQPTAAGRAAARSDSLPSNAMD